MAYVDPGFQAFRLLPVVGDMQAGVALGTNSTAGGGTATYSGNGTASINGAYVFPQFLRPVVLTNVVVFCQTRTAPGTNGISNAQIFIMNGTNTAATVLLGTATTGQFVTGTIAASTVGSNGATTSPAQLTSNNGQFTMIYTDTNTATASSLGKYAIWFEYKDLFVT